ncbi:MAG: hypothetical protein NC350_01245 [Corallococcus sp.]|nr:hypothetical protein [Corallococcus sp.]
MNPLYHTPQLSNNAFLPLFIAVTDEYLLKELSAQDTRWWCKVEDGYILNLKDERKNKIPYKYDS